MTSLKSNSKTLVPILIIIPALLIVFGITISSSCTFQHVNILNDIQKFEKELDPEFCAALVEKIDIFNEDCEPEIEILDCG